jgi:CHAT domain-containing protein
LFNMGLIYSKRRQFDEAAPLFAEVRQIAAAHSYREGAASALAELSNIALEQGRVAEALAGAQEALAAARQSASPEAILGSLDACGRALEKSGRPAEAEADYREAITTAEAIRAEAPAYARSLDATMEKLQPAYRLAVNLLLGQGRTEEAWQLSERTKARILSDLLAGGDPSIAESLTAAEREEEDRLRSLMTAARREARAHSSPAASLARENAERAFESYEQRLYGRHPEMSVQRADFEPARAAALTALFPGRGTALLSYFALPDGDLALFVVRAPSAAGRPAVSAFRLPWNAARESEARDFRNRLARRDLDYQPVARRLFDALIAPAVAQLAGTTAWVIAPQGALWDVPFQALIDPSGRHVIETRAISYTPSLTVLARLRRPLHSTPPALRALLAVSYGGTGAAAIPEADAEAAAIARQYRGALLLTGAEASPARFREAAPPAAVIHVAAHGDLDGAHPLESALALAPSAAGDGALTAREIMGIHLAARLVVLSACETARGRESSSEGLMGLGWALAAAGAPSSILSQWKVDSAATRDLMIALHRRLATREAAGPAAALRLAALALRAQPGRQHPFYWAGFAAFGDPR